MNVFLYNSSIGFRKEAIDCFKSFICTTVDCPTPPAVMTVLTGVCPLMRKYCFIHVFSKISKRFNEISAVFTDCILEKIVQETISLIMFFLISVRGIQSTLHMLFLHCQKLWPIV